MAINPMTEEKAENVFSGIPLSVLRKNLINIFKDYGVTDKFTYKLADESGPYYYLLDKKNGRTIRRRTKRNGILEGLSRRSGKRDFVQ